MELASPPQTPKAIEFLRTLYLERKSNRPHYSVPAFARDLGLSKSFLWRLLKGERPLTVKQAIQISAVLDLSPETTDDLIAKVVSESGKNAKISKAFRKTVQAKSNASANAAAQITHFELERFKVISQWYHLAILNLVKLQDFEPNTNYIAKRLGISKLEASDAVARLVSLGLLEKKAGKFKRTKVQLFVENQNPEAAMRNYFTQTLERAKESLKDPSQSAFDERFISGVTMAVSAQDVARLKKRLQEIQMEFMKPITSDHLSQVYQLNLQFFPLTKKETKK